MMRLFEAGGPYMIPLTVLAGVVVVLSIRSAIELFVRGGRDPERLALGLDAILFWGSISAVLGLLGQFSGLYRSLQVIRHAAVVSPQFVAQGIAQSLITTLFGLSILAVSAIIWFGLTSRLNRLNGPREASPRATV